MIWLPALPLLLGLPMLGAWASGQPLAPYLSFPPIPRPIEQPAFNPSAFVLLTLGLLAVIVPTLIRVLRGKGTAAPPPCGRFPWWGWAGLAGGIATWIVAWTRIDALAAVQMHTFAPQWLAYIVVVNALAMRQSGECMMISRPGYFLSLFLASAGFWWFFEYLNRFVANWHYQGIGELSPSAYFLRATLPFATVLPAVLGTYDYLRRRWGSLDGLRNAVPLNPRRPKLLCLAVLMLGSAGLLLTSVFPTVLFPLLWIAPLAVLSSLRSLAGHRTLFAPVKHGDWRRLYLLAIAGLICGFFWEMWNMYSLARWEYTVPYVHAWQIFEMPILGFAGYIPFAWECAVVAQSIAVMGGRWNPPRVDGGLVAPWTR